MWRVQRIYLDSFCGEWIWVSVCSISFVQRTFFVSWLGFCSFVKDQLTTPICIDLWPLSPDPLICLSVLLLAPYCINYSSFRICLLTLGSVSPLTFPSWILSWLFLLFYFFIYSLDKLVDTLKKPYGEFN